MSWFKHNLYKRKNGQVSDFDISFSPEPFKTVSFNKACEELAKSISKDNPRLYLSYSGGLDSEFVLKTFTNVGIPISPVAISTSFNKKELSWAKKYCDANNIKLTIIEMTDVQFITKLYHKTYDKGLYAMLGAVPDIVHDYYGGVVLTGNPSPFDLNDPKILEFCEYDFYDFGGNVINFFAGSQDVMYSTVKEADSSLTTQQAKAKLYGLEYRDKIKYDPVFYKINNELRPFDFNYRKFMDRDEFLKAFDSVILPEC